MPRKKKEETDQLKKEKIAQKALKKKQKEKEKALKKKQKAREKKLKDKKKDNPINDKILDLIKEICTVSDRRFNIQVIYRYCLENSVLKNYHDLEEIFLVLEKEGKIYNIGGTSWILPKPKRVR